MNGKILYKTWMLELLKAGAFGNQLQTWSVCEYRASGFAGRVLVRYAGKPGIPLPGYNDSPQWEAHEVEAYIASWIAVGAEQERIYVQEAPDDSLLVMNVEVVRDSNYYSIRYNRTPNIGLRAAMRRDDAVEARGIAALMILQGAMTESDFADLEAILEKWPDAVVEMSVWSRFIGNLKGRRSIVWEVRHY